MLQRMFGAQREFVEAQYRVQKICMEQQLMQSMMCNMCSMPSNACFCGPSFGCPASSCVTKDNVTYETISYPEASATVTKFVQDNKGTKVNDIIKTIASTESTEFKALLTSLSTATALVEVSDVIKNLFKNDKKDLLKRFAVYLIDKHSADFVQ